MKKPFRISRDIRPLSEFRANTAKFVRQVQETRRPLVLTQHGRGATVLLDVEEHERLVEQAELAKWIVTNHPGAAEDLVDGTFGAVKRLAEFPLSGREIPHSLQQLDENDLGAQLVV